MKKGISSTKDTDLWAASRAPIQATIDALLNPVALVDSEGELLLVNPGWEVTARIRSGNLKTAIDAMITRHNWNVAPNERARFAHSLEELLSGRRRQCRLVSVRGQNLVDAGALQIGKAAALVTLDTDTPRTEPAVDPSEQPSPGRIQSASFHIDSEGIILDWGPDGLELFGRPAEETVGQHISLLLASNASGLPGKELLASLDNDSKQRIELRMKRSGGTYFDGALLLSMASDGGGNRIQCSVTTISERQRAVGVLRRSEERLRYALEAASDGLWDWDLQTGSMVFSPRVSEIFEENPNREGVGPADISTWESRIHPDDNPERERQLQRHLEGETPAFESEYRIRTEAGNWKWVGVRGRVTERDAAAKPVRMIGTVTDISERKFAQEALRGSEEQYRNLFEYASDAVVLFDPENGRVRDANQKAEQLLGHSSDALKQMVIRDLHPPDQWNRIENALAESHSGESGLLEVDGLTHNGKRIPLETNTRLVSYGGQQVYQSFMRDVSERRALELQLRQSQKMETVGRLAGGIAHDFNNLLTAIQGYTTLLQSALAEGSEEREMTEEIFNAVQRASRLTMQLLTFSRHETPSPNPTPLNLNAIVDDMEKMLRRLIGEHVRLETSLNTTLGTIRGDRSRIEQVITNLVINAADAMPDGGTLAIRTENVHIDQEQARRPAAPKEGDYALLSVEDEGEGMSSETLAHIFEPFFTTKAPGSGTGLGLATVYGIVKQSEGHISVESEPGKGTKFRIHLPVRAGDRQVQSQNDTPATARPGKETVLIVEDEPAVRRLTRRFVEASGYRVVEASDVGDAIRMAKENSEVIDLLLTDVIMPELSGPELAKRLRVFLPSLKVLYMSGYPGEYIARHGVSNTEAAYLQKPFSQEALTGKMREVLDA